MKRSLGKVAMLVGGYLLGTTITLMVKEMEEEKSNNKKSKRKDK